MKTLLLFALAALVAAGPALAQDAASANWALTSDTLATTTGAISALGLRSKELVVRDYTGTLNTTPAMPGPLGPYQRQWLGGAAWPDESAPNPARYTEFVVAPKSTTSAPLTITTISLVMNAGGTGSMKASLFAATDRAFTNPTALQTEVAVARDAVGRFTFTVDKTLAGTDSLYVRIYPWVRSSSTGAGRYLFLQDVTISGTTVTAPPTGDVKGVFWALTAADTTSVSGAGPNLGGARERSSTLTARDYTGTLRDAGDAPGPLGPFQRLWLGGAVWPDEMAANPDRFVEFAAGASAGRDFRVDSLSVYIHGAGTSAMMARIAYSTSADFSSPVVLEDNIKAGDGDFGGPTLRSYAINKTASDSVYVRVYPWVRSSTTGSGRYLLLQAMTIYGEAVMGTASEPAAAARRARLFPSVPNPARGTTAVRYELADAGDVTVEVFNALGQRVLVLADGAQAAGAHEAPVNASALPAGVYVVRLSTGDGVQTGRFTVVR